MDRRTFVKGGLACLVGGHLDVPAARAYQQCVGAPNFTGQLCEAGIAPPAFVHTYHNQTSSMWCWAASISMIFSYYGYSVSQQRIVSEAFGSPLNLPANGTLISAQLSKEWTDDDGRTFSAELEGVYDVDTGTLGITNSMIVDALSSERPLLMGNVSHAMVLVSAAYMPTSPEPTVVNVGLLDPYPGMGARGAQGPAEMVPMHMGGALRYLALPRIEEV
ncbi:papain-like cysteine protease family protein [Rhizobium sp. NXC14]|uniref:papain-like cysteine protease family protein n=1 Tax=Rhizobium sp. NXC14 TaxID=1981173 RepID=UPI000A26A259|nr:papain-like cysteine protease family protein [Rhizobium sp. NXC14]